MINRKFTLILGFTLIIILIGGYVTFNWGTEYTPNQPDNNTPNNSTTGDNTNNSTSNNNNDNPANNVPNNPSTAEMTLDIDPLSGVTVNGATATITSAGTYTLSGTMEDGRIIVNINGEESVTLVLDGVNISCSTHAPIYVAKAKNVFVVLADGSENILADNENNDDDSVLLSRDNLTLSGNGSLTVIANNNDGIRSNSGLTIESGTIKVTSIDDGIYGKDFLVIKGGAVEVNCVGDGLKVSKNVTDQGMGYISIEDGTIDVTSTEGDAVTAQTDVIVSGGTLTLTSGGGSGVVKNELLSTKGLKAGGNIVIDDGTFSIDSSDDTIHANGLVVINNGTFEVASGDEGILAGISLEINGGTIDVTQSGDGIKSAAVTINGGNVQIDSDDDGVSSEDSLVITGGDITVHSVGDGLKSENSVDVTKGDISIEDGTITVVSTKGDAVTAQTDLVISGGTFTLTCGGGSDSSLIGSSSTKGLKAGVSIVIESGTFNIDSYDDAIHSNDVIVINNGIYNIASGSKAIHADTSVEINGGTINIAQCYEGIESITVTINDGHIEITASDDGINVRGGAVVSGGGGGGWPGGGGFEEVTECYIYIHGGFIYIDSGGDGLDTGGYIVMTDGIVIIDGPIPGSAPNGAIDYASGEFNLTGGTLVAVGMSGMVQGPSTTSTQYSVIVTFRTQQSAGTLINIQTSTGQGIITFRPTKAYQSIVFSSSALTRTSYSLYLGGTSTGTLSYGIYTGGTYTPGTRYATFTISSIVTNVSGSTFP